MNPADPDALLEVVRRQRVKRELTCDEREEIVCCLLWMLQNDGINGTFPRETPTVMGN